MARRILYSGLPILVVVVGLFYQERSAEDAAPNPKEALPLTQKKATAEAVSEVKKKGKYSPSIVPDGMTVPEKKKRFKALLVPVINRVYRELDRQYREVEEAIKSGKEGTRIARLKIEYRAETTKELLAALRPHPQSIALAQAAMESGWGTSRFFVKANNVFGVWSFDQDEPRIAAGGQRGNKTIWVKKYASIYASVKDYYRVLARGEAFEDFRTLRMKTENPYQLVKELDQYSEKGDEYGKELASMIRFNKFVEYDEASVRDE